jgi:hypothetical protein
LGDTLFKVGPQVFPKFIELKEGRGPRSFTHVLKLGFNTRCSNKLVIKKFLKEASHVVLL